MFAAAPDAAGCLGALVRRAGGPLCAIEPRDRGPREQAPHAHYLPRLRMRLRRSRRSGPQRTHPDPSLHPARWRSAWFGRRQACRSACSRRRRRRPSRPPSRRRRGAAGRCRDVCSSTRARSHLAGSAHGRGAGRSAARDRRQRHLAGGGRRDSRARNGAAEPPPRWARSGIAPTCCSSGRRSGTAHIRATS